MTGEGALSRSNVRKGGGSKKLSKRQGKNVNIKWSYGVGLRDVLAGGLRKLRRAAPNPYATLELKISGGKERTRIVAVQRARTTGRENWGCS